METSNPRVQFRKARVADAKAIYRLINACAERNEMLPRSFGDVCENLRDFHVCECEGRLVACCALHLTWEDIAEIRSVTVEPGRRGARIGHALVHLCIAEGREMGIKHVFVLTYIPQYFQKFGFKEVSKDVLPHKIWSDCVKCPKFPDCGETAMILEDPC